VANWRLNDVNRQVLRNAIAHGVMRILENGSETVDQSILTRSGEYADSSLYAKGIVESAATSIRTSYKDSDLSNEEELLSQFKRLLISKEAPPYTKWASLSSALTKYVSSADLIPTERRA